MKLLLVDDNKMLARMITKKVSSVLKCDFDIAYDFAEAKEFLDNNQYFAALLDLCLPDAMHGQVVDYALSKKIPSIILTGLDDDATRKSFMDKDIVDYVLKDGNECVDYIIDIIERLQRNENTKIIVAEDSSLMRNVIKNILKSYKFQVFPAAHGAEALGYLEQHPDVKLILSDKEMPVISGEELIREVRCKYNKNQLGIIVLTAHGSDDVGVRMLKSGANDFIQKPFSRENLICRVNSSIDLIYYLEQLKESAEKDFLTKLNNRKSFFEIASAYYSQIDEKTTFAVLMADIDKFKSINDTLGHAAGDSVIIRCAHTLLENVKGGDTVARFGGEEFCVLVKNITKENAIKMAVKIRSMLKNTPALYCDKHINFTASLGLALGNKNIPIEDMIKRADEALYEAKENGRDRVEIYNGGEID
ncbi:diguanylate cyclase [Campylobacter sp. MG1]|uniref:GGDEF domain-containing response regulator n=1 Tax=Campylobacter sp. MG1 TaxID=2976332 RepID=UPI00226CAB5E|nr:diguanylate cyclase [Campylobacter sp. MG1]